MATNPALGQLNRGIIFDPVRQVRPSCPVSACACFTPMNPVPTERVDGTESVGGGLTNERGRNIIFRESSAGSRSHH